MTMTNVKLKEELSMRIKRLGAWLMVLVCCLGLLSVSASAYTADRDLLMKRMNANAFKGRITYASMYNIDKVSAGDLKAAAEEMRRINAKVIYNFDTLKDNEVIARVTVNPFLVKLEDSYNYNFMLWIDATQTQSYKTAADAYFGKSTAVIITAHYNYGMSVVISAKLNLTGMDTANLAAYSYNATTGAYTLIENANVTVDSAGFTHLQTAGAAGYIIIVEK